MSVFRAFAGVGRPEKVSTGTGESAACDVGKLRSRKRFALFVAAVFRRLVLARIASGGMEAGGAGAPVAFASASGVRRRGGGRRSRVCAVAPRHRRQVPLASSASDGNHAGMRREGNEDNTELSPVASDSVAAPNDEELEEMIRSIESGEKSTEEKYMPGVDRGDPIVDALASVCGCRSVRSFHLIDSRWNGNEVLRYVTDRGLYFVKMNRVEDPSVFMTEAIGLTTIKKTNTLRCPMPLHVGRLPKVGAFGPGAFMILEYLPLLPFGANRPEAQAELGDSLARMHLDRSLSSVHEGRFGFVVNNFLSLTPMDNRWSASWPVFLSRRLLALARALYQSKNYARAPLSADDVTIARRTQQLVEQLEPRFFSGVSVQPSLLHGDLWIGNAGATKSSAVVFDPACFFGHHEMDLAIMPMFGGFGDGFYDAYHALIPKAEGFEHRQKLYRLYHYLNQLNLFGNLDVKLEVEKLLEQLCA